MTLSRKTAPTGRKTRGILTGTWNAPGHPLYRPTWAEIDRRAFQGNLRRLKTKCGARTELLAVVKANAYGHAAAPLAAEAAAAGAAMLGVSSLEEGIALRESGIARPILILGSIYPLENLAVAQAHRLIPTISSLKGLSELARLGARSKRPQPFHLKIDTGMGRVGVSPETAPALLERIAGRRELALQGIYMHFAAADSDPVCTREQLSRFLPVVERARQLGLRFDAHAANSAAILKYRRSHLDLVRPGIALYGLLPYEGAGREVRLEPVLSWKTRIVFLKRVRKGTPISYCRTFVTKRPSLIATLPVGYADGYSRQFSNRAAVLVRGRRCPVAGRVTMDMVMADVTGVPGVTIGDEVTLMGSQGNERITAEELAKIAGTINYEITCAIGSRVPRVIV